MEHDVFISYSEQDKAVADAACASLEQRGVRCWIAPRDVPAGHSWAASLVEAIATSRVFVLILSNGSNASQQVIREVGEAVDNTLPIIPFRIENVEMSDDMRYYIKSIHWLDAMSPPLEHHLDRLVALVEGALVAGADSPPGSAVTSPAPAVGPVAAAGTAISGGRPWFRNSLVWGAASIIVVLLGVLGLVLGSGGDGAADDEGQVAADADEDAVAPTTAMAPSSNRSTVPTPPATTAVPEPAVAVFEETFDGGLDTGWAWLFENPETWSLADGGLEILADDTGSNRLVRDVPEEPYEITTLLRFTPTSNFQFAGLIVQGERWEDWIQFGRAYCDPSIAGCIGNAIYFDNLRSSEIFGVSGSFPYEGGEEVYLRIAADGDRYAGYFSPDGESWTQVGSQTGESFRRIGLVAHQGYEASTPAEFAFVTIAPIGADIGQ